MKICTSNKAVPVWTGKLPSYLIDHISSVGTDNLIGEIFIPDETDGPNVTPTFVVSKSIAVGGAPKEYTIKFNDKRSCSYLFSLGNVANIEGTIVKEISFIPKHDARYFEALRSRPVDRKSMTVCFNYLKDVGQRDRFGSVSELDLLARRRKKLLQAKKRERLEKSEAIDIIFRAFEKQDAWTVRDLADFSGQPVAYIQEILPEICVINKREYRSLYELKPEYRGNNRP